MKNSHNVLIVLPGLILLIALVGLNHFLPVGPGDYNTIEVKKIETSHPSDRFSFAVMGDDRDGYALFQDILHRIDAERFLFAIDDGDLVRGGTREHFRAFFTMIDHVRTPFLTAIGNHDLHNGRDTEFSRIFGRTYYAFAFSNSLFVVLDDSGGYQIDPAQMKWLEQQLQKNFRHKFVFMHVPPFDPVPGENKCLHDRSNAEAFMSLMEKYRPDAVFASHIHGYFSVFRNNVHYLFTGGAGAPLMENGFNNFIRVDVSGRDVREQVIPVHNRKDDSLSGYIRESFLDFWIMDRFSFLYIFLVSFILFDIIFSLMKNPAGTGRL